MIVTSSTVTVNVGRTIVSAAVPIELPLKNYVSNTAAAEEHAAREELRLKKLVAANQNYLHIRRKR